MRAFAGEASVKLLQLDHIPDALAVFDTELHCLACSRRWRGADLLGDREPIDHSNCEIRPRVSVTLRAKFQRAIAGDFPICNAEPLKDQVVRSIMCDWPFLSSAIKLENSEKKIGDIIRTSEHGR